MKPYVPVPAIMGSASNPHQKTSLAVIGNFGGSISLTVVWHVDGEKRLRDEHVTIKADSPRRAWALAVAVSSFMGPDPRRPSWLLTPLLAIIGPEPGTPESDDLGDAQKVRERARLRAETKGGWTFQEPAAEAPRG